MIKIESPFTVLQPPQPLSCFRRRPSSGDAATRSVLLQGLRVAVQLGGRSYELLNESAPSGDGFRSRGFGWVRNDVPLTPGMSLEHQMFLAHGGNTVAFSWRLSGEQLAAVRLTAAPVFSASRSITVDLFAFEAETNGGRLTWQPFHGSAKIVADTNGRFTTLWPFDGYPPGAASQMAAPAVFEFDLGRRPAVLMFSVEAQPKAAIDPLIGCFLAELTKPPTATPNAEYFGSRIAA